MENTVQQQTAIIGIDGKQIPVSEGQSLWVDYRNLAPGATVLFDKVHVLFDGSTTTVGAPYIENARVQAEVLSQEQGKKIIVFKKKRRKGYKVRNGFRKKYTSITIKKIITQ